MCGDEYLRLSYHGFRAKNKTSMPLWKHTLMKALAKYLVPQDIGRVLLNLFNNAFYAVHEKIEKRVNGSMNPIVFVGTKK